jgi:hypothetical protein
VTPAEYKQLETFINRRRANLTTHYEIAWHLSWLLRISLEQTKPEWTHAERLREVRRLLLVDVQQEIQNVRVPGLGVSPLLVCVNRRTRNWLETVHHINVAALESNAEQLYQGLEQFDKAQPDFRSRADIYTNLLIEHHQRVRVVGELVGGEVGDALIDEADLAITRLQTK